MFNYIIYDGRNYGVITTNIVFRKGDIYNNGNHRYKIVCFA